jgi:hypothetical protein
VRLNLLLAMSLCRRSHIPRLPREEEIAGTHTGTRCTDETGRKKAGRGPSRQLARRINGGETLAARDFSPALRPFVPKRESLCRGEGGGGGGRAGQGRAGQGRNQFVRHPRWAATRGDCVFTPPETRRTVATFNSRLPVPRLSLSLSPPPRPDSPRQLDAHVTDIRSPASCSPSPSRPRPARIANQMERTPPPSTAPAPAPAAAAVTSRGRRSRGIYAPCSDICPPLAPSSCRADGQPASLALGRNGRAIARRMSDKMSAEGSAGCRSE